MRRFGPTSARAAMVLAGYVGLVLAVMIWLTLSGHAGGSAVDPGWPANGPCTVTLSGHDMNATVEGQGAALTCRSWLHGGEAGSPSGSRQCAYARAGLSITVMDSGNAFYGWAFCTHLQIWRDSGGAIPDLSDDSFVPALPSDSPTPGD